MQESQVIELQEGAPGLGRVPPVALLRAILFLLAVVGLVIGAHYYVGARLFAGLGLTGRTALAAWATLWGLLLAILAAPLARHLPHAMALPLRALACAWMGLFALFLSATAAVDVASALASVLLGRSIGDRWGFFESAAVLGVVVPSFAWGTYRAIAPARIERVIVPISGLPAELEGFRIVQLSDLHIGDTMGRAFAQRVVEQANGLEPDLIAVTGDLADGSAARVRHDVEPLRGLEAKDGVLFVTGNHEYYNGVGGWLAEIRRLGMDVLLNEHRVVRRGAARLVVGGVTDFNGGERLPEHASCPTAAFAGAPDGAPRILLAHQPRSAFQARGLDVALQLSGHTHGGQFLPWSFIVRMQQPVLAGLATVGEVRVYTHRGTGFWGPPLRLFAPPEIAVITLVRASEVRGLEERLEPRSRGPERRAYAAAPDIRMTTAPASEAVPPRRRRRPRGS